MDKLKSGLVVCKSLINSLPDGGKLGFECEVGRLNGILKLLETLLYIAVHSGDCILDQVKTLFGRDEPSLD